MAGGSGGGWLGRGEGRGTGEDGRGAGGGSVGGGELGRRKSAPPGRQEVEGKGGRGKSTILSDGLGFTDIPSKQLQTFTF